MSVPDNKLVKKAKINVYFWLKKCYNKKSLEI